MRLRTDPETSLAATRRASRATTGARGSRLKGTFSARHSGLIVLATELDRTHPGARGHGVVAGPQFVRQRVALVHRGCEPCCGAVCVAPELGLVHQRLGGHAGDVYAGAAVHLVRLLHHHDPATGGSEGSSERLACLAPTDDEQVGLDALHGPMVWGGRASWRRGEASGRPRIAPRLPTAARRSSRRFARAGRLLT